MKPILVLACQSKGFAVAFVIIEEAPSVNSTLRAVVVVECPMPPKTSYFSLSLRYWNYELVCSVSILNCGWVARLFGGRIGGVNPANNQMIG